jgi:prevent-host-death family protein
MERYVWVRNARARFADVLNTAAYGSERVVILRRGEELGAFVGTADLDHLRRTKPLSRYPEPKPPEMPPDPDEQERLWLEERQRHLDWCNERARKNLEAARARARDKPG